ncbi:hypothetical protein J2W25_000874 [Variovorax boronicumulans]|uniref:Uncharacterized protein n=1 Tax=Variovorax boronicumulans TaxID=436515 RepID=A0AAW8DQR4_9BURK|nr:hypothetical protein [Variovorax boronicumulans]MDP9877264.1 hypothetical protein [Variovorax boronicumulans]MDP9921859.1 hypothetical protein [Variovorax boronicumulans]
MSNTELRVRVLLTLQVALLGMVTANMRSVLVSWNKTEVHIRLVFNEVINDTDVEIASEIESEVISHLPGQIVRCEAETIPLDIKVMPREGEVLVFHRASS